MSNVFNLLAALMNDAPRREKGQGLAEYALILALIAIVVIVAMQFLGTPDQHDPEHSRIVGLTPRALPLAFGEQTRQSPTRRSVPIV